MNEFIEKLIARLEEEKGTENEYFTAEGKTLVRHWNNCVDVCKESINQLAKEYSHCTLCYLQSPCEYQNADIRLPASEFADNNGWITCSERLPEEHDSIFAKLKGTDEWNNEMFEKISGVVNVTVIDKYGNTVTTYAHTVDGKWCCDLLKCDKLYQIIAWQPLPAPYMKEGD